MEDLYRNCSCVVLEWYGPKLGGYVFQDQSCAWSHLRLWNKKLPPQRSVPGKVQQLVATYLYNGWLDVAGYLPLIGCFSDAALDQSAMENPSLEEAHYIHSKDSFVHIWLKKIWRTTVNSKKWPVHSLSAIRNECLSAHVTRGKVRL